jgi:hypothetical protein
LSLFLCSRIKTWMLVLGSKEDKYRYMVERLGVTSDAGGVDVLVSYPFTFTHSSPPSPYFFVPRRSMLFFLASILSFVWRTGSEDDPSSHAPLSATAVLGPRVTITGVLVLGLVYLAMIVKTLMRYGRGWGVMRAGAGMGMTVGAISVQGEQGTEGGREGSERDIGKDGERRSTRRRGGSVDRHAEARERVKEGISLGGLR